MDPACNHFRKPYNFPGCHALCHAPKIHMHLHKEKEGLLDVASDTAMAVKSRGYHLAVKDSPIENEAANDKVSKRYIQK